MRRKLQTGQRTVVRGSISPENKVASLGSGLVFQKMLVSGLELSWCGFIIGVAF